VPSASPERPDAGGTPSPRASAGSVYVIYSQPIPGRIDLATIDPALTGYRIDGAAAGDHAGASVADVGDLNGDGVADIGIGAPGRPPPTAAATEPARPS